MAKNINSDKRVYILTGIVVVIVLVYIIQLFNLQVLSSDYKESAAGNAFLKKIVYPQRGILTDRNGELLVTNQPTYDILFIPREVLPFDTLDFCKTIGMTVEEFKGKMEGVKLLPSGKRNPSYSVYTLQTLLTQLSVEEAAVLQEKLYQFPGFSLQKRFLRQYNKHNAGLLLGYVAELNPTELEADNYYRRGDYGGKSGIEASYEKFLRGEKGTEVLLRDAHGRIKGKYEEGKLDVKAISGKNVKLSLDIELQAYGEQLMQNKIGCIVMIEPSSGEILALVSAPSYDPALLLGRDYGRNFAALEQNPLKPLFNRATQAKYPPGSTFKVPQGLVFLQEEAVNVDVRYPCAHGYIPLGGKPKCHTHVSPVSIIPAIATSCNAYFPYGLTNMLSNRTKYKDINEAFEVWKNHMVSMGFGYRLGVDIPYEGRGFIPNSEFYTKAHKTSNWKAANIISTAIGQGEIEVTPIQMANFAALVANRGYYYTPHLVKEIQDTPLDSKFTEKKYATIDKEYFDIVAQGMEMSVTAGTSRRANLLPFASVAGKTGTAENPHGKDHSMWMGFAPADEPKVAIFVIVENAGFGATFGVPIGRLMLQKYLGKELNDMEKWIEQDMMTRQLMPSTYYTKKEAVTMPNSSLNR